MGNFREFAVGGFVQALFRFGKLTALSAAIVLIASAAPALAATYTVTNLNDSGAGSLRDAINLANASVGVADTINLNTVPATGTINLLTALPAITDTVAIINLNTGSGRVELNGLATQNGAVPSIGFDIQAPNCEIWGFVINRFGDAGIRVGPNSTGTTNGDGTIIHQNYIGTAPGGTSVNCPDAAHPCGNINRGVWVDGASNVQVGDGTFNGHSNTISGNFGRGVSVNNKTIGATTFPGSAIIKNNRIGGTDSIINPNTAIGNTQDGILLAGVSNCQIGGVNPLDGNVIIANGGNGINIVADKTNTINSPASGNVIQANNIGYTGGSNNTVPNSGSGIVIEGSNNTVGGTTAAARNIITGNHVNGISIYGALATGNTVQGNYIGVGSNGTTAFGNDVAGIQIAQSASNNTIGGTGVTPGQCNGPCNIIANNGAATAQSAKAGLYLDATSGTGNAIRGNSIFNNGSGTGIGIDLVAVLSDGTSNPNAPVGKNTDDACDADTGANNLQNRPVITTANNSGFISGTLNSTASTAFVIDFFLNPTSDTQARSQARTYIGSVNTTTTAGCTATFFFSSTVLPTVGQFITATATRSAAPLDTSEIADAVAVVTTPTAAPVNVFGRIISSTGKGISNAVVTMTDMAGTRRSARTGSFGYFGFRNVQAGESYIVSVASKRYQFATRIINVTDNIDDLELVAEP